MDTFSVAARDELPYERENCLFDGYVNNVRGFLNLMEAQEVVASGNAVFHALYQDFFVLKSLQLYCARSKLKEVEWDDLLSSEGYTLVDNLVSTRGVEVSVICMFCELADL